MAYQRWISLSGACAERRASRKEIVPPDIFGETQKDCVCVEYELPGYLEQDAPYAQGGACLLDVPEAGYVTEKGAPMLVREGLLIELPHNAKYCSVDAEILCKKELPEKYNILPAPQDVPETKQLTFRKNEMIYGSDEAYPSEAISYVRTLELDGGRYVHLFVFPFQYLPKKKQLTAFTKIKITVHYEPETTAIADADRTGKIAARRIQASVRLDPNLLVAPQKTAAASAASEEKPRMVIISTKELAYSLRILEGVKTFLYDAEIIYVETIKEKYPNMDTAAAIHSCLMDEHKKKPISYVLLGGGTDKIPCKMIDAPGVSDPVASDNFYCISGDPSEPLPLFALGRMPVSTVPEMNDLVDYAAYYNRFYNAKRKRAVFIAEDNTQSGFKECKQEIKATLEGDFAVAECYDGDSDKSDVISEINKGVGFINYRGSGAYDAWESANGLSVGDLAKLAVVRDTPHVLSLDCKSCAIDKQGCLGVEWMRQLKAVSFLGASGTTYTMANNAFDKYLWECIHDKKLTKIGDIFKTAVLELYRNSPDLFTVTNILEYLLLGDPTADYMDDRSDTDRSQKGTDRTEEGSYER